MTLAFSGTVLALQRITPEMIKVTIRDTKGGLYDMQLPFSIEGHFYKLDFGLDEMVSIHIESVILKGEAIGNTENRPTER